MQDVSKLNFFDRIGQAVNEGMKGFTESKSPDFLGKGFDGIMKASSGFFFTPRGQGYASARATADVAGWPNVSRNQIAAPTVDEELLVDLQLLREQSRDLYKNSCIGRGAIKVKTTSVIGRGLEFRSNIDRELLGMADDEADAYEDYLERDFQRWAESTACDIECGRNFYEMQELLLSCELQSGDVFVALPICQTAADNIPQMRMQIIEADKVMNPWAQMDTWAFRGGIELDKNGAPVRYHIKNDNWTWQSVNAYGTISRRRNILHLFKTERPGQSRGVPFLTPVASKIKQLSRYSDAEVTRALIQSSFAAFIRSQNPDALEDPARYGEKKSIYKKSHMRIEPGSIYHLLENDDVTFANPTSPNSGADKFIDLGVREVGMGLEIPFEIFVKQFMASYSASRASRIEWWRSVESDRVRFNHKINNPIREERMAFGILSGQIKLPRNISVLQYFQSPVIRQAILGCTWTGDGMGQIDETKEVDAAVARVNARFSTIQSETTMLNGGDFMRNMRQQRKEQKVLIDYGLTQNIPPSQISTTEKLLPPSD